MQETNFPNTATPAGSSAYYCIRFSPKKYRDQLARLFLYKQTLRELYHLSDPGVARIKLQWWQEQISETKGRSDHPLARQLADLYQTSETAKQAFEQITKITDRRLHRQPLESINDYQTACISLGGSFADLIQLASEQTISEHTKMAGAWIEHVENMQLFGRLLRENIHLLPVELLTSFSISEDQLLSSVKTPEVLEKLHQQVSYDFYKETVDKSVRKSCLGKLMRLRTELMQLIEEEDMAVINQHISLTPIRKLWLAI